VSSLYEDYFVLPLGLIGDEERSLGETVLRWAKEVSSKRAEHDEDFSDLLMPSMKKLFVDIGLQSMLVPLSLGGGGLSAKRAPVTCALAIEECSRGDTGIAFILSNIICVQKALLCSSTIGSYQESVFKEFNSESPFISPLILPGYGTGNENPVIFHGLYSQVRAELKGDEITISGKDVRPQCSGLDAKLFCVFCVLDDGNPSLILVQGDSSGIQRSEEIKKTGLAASRNCDLDFRDVKVPKDNIILEGESAIKEILSWYYLCASATVCGAAIAAYEILFEWVSKRFIKGTGNILKENPLVASLLGEIGAGIIEARNLTFNLALHIGDRGENSGSPDALFAFASAVFLKVPRVCTEVIDRSMELMASAGYASEWQLERYWRDAKTVETYVLPETCIEVSVAKHIFDISGL